MQKYNPWTAKEIPLNLSVDHQLIGWDYDKYKIANLNFNYCQISKELSSNFVH